MSRVKQPDDLTPEARRLLVHVRRTAIINPIALACPTAESRKARAFLLRYGFVERKRALAPGGRRIVWRYGITSRGREALKEQP